MRRGRSWGPGIASAAFNEGSCGSPYHDGIRFECVDNKGIKIFYLPARNSYYVAGKGRVTYYGWRGKPRKVQECENALAVAPGRPKVR